MKTGVVEAKDLQNNLSPEHHLRGRLLRAVCTRRSYCVTITVEEMLRLIEKDKRGIRTLLQLLSRGTAAIDVNYDAHLGPNIFFALHAEDDKPTRTTSKPSQRARIVRIIREYIKEK